MPIVVIIIIVSIVINIIVVTVIIIPHPISQPPPAPHTPPSSPPTPPPHPHQHHPLHPPQGAYPKGQALRWFVYWRLFYLACSELFRFNNGEEWGVCHYLFTNKGGADLTN